MNYKVEPWAHQKEAIERASTENHFALFFEMGTGKTATAINILRKWSIQKGRLLRTLIFCPPIVIDQWADEFRNHSEISEKCIVRLKGPGAKRVSLLEKHLQSDLPQVFITNYETLLMKPCYKKFLEGHFEVLICDESHKLKSYSAKRTKLCTVLSDMVPRKLILTGSPVLNTPMDVFPQFRILDGGKTFGNNFFVFRARYFYDGNAGMPKHKYFPNWKPRPDCVKEINKLIYQKAMHVEKSRCLDLPPLIRQEVFAELSKEQRKVYEAMKEDLVAYLSNKSAAIANMALTKALRLQQIVSGFVTTDQKSTHRFKELPRLKVLAELLESLVPQHKVIVWASFQENYRRIKDVCKEMGIDSVEIHGLCSEKEKRAAIDDFREKDSTRVVIANQKAGGVGLNLTEASYCIYYSRGYSLEDDIQSEARNYRGGSERHEKVTRIDIIAPQTIDQIIVKALKRKQNLADSILGIGETLSAM